MADDAPAVAVSPSERTAPEAAPDMDYEQLEKPTVRLADAGGMEAVKARLGAALLVPLRNLKLGKYCRLNFGIALIALVFVASSGSAQAATTDFIGQLSPNTLPESPAMTLAGDQLTAFNAQLRPATCAGVSDPRSIDDDDIFRLELAPGADVQLQGGHFSYSGVAQAEYGSSSSYSLDGGQFTIIGSVNPAHTVVTASITLADATDGTVNGCSGSYDLIAIPRVTPTYRPPDARAYQSQFVDFDYANGTVSNLRVQANFECSGSMDAATFTGAAYGYPAVQTSRNGTFSISTYVLDEYSNIVHLTLSGRISGSKANGRIVISEPPGGFEMITNIGGCAGNYGWSGSRPVPPPPPGPTAFFQWTAIRVPAGTTYRYYFAVTDLTCTVHANELLVTVDRHTITLPCSNRAAFASGPLAPSRTYEVRSEAVQARGGRIVRRGAPLTAPLQMPGPGDLWVVISGLPGTPPS